MPAAAHGRDDHRGPQDRRDTAVVVASADVIADVEADIRPGARLWFEYIGCRSLLAQLRPDVIYTQFGPHWPAARVRHVVGCAYSNLLYPEIDFWGKLPFLQRTVRKLVDVERTRRLMTADHIIFETEDLAQRAIKFLQRTQEQISCVRPSVSSLIGLETEHFATRVRCEAIPSGFRVLLLSVPHPNKNIELLPEIAVELRDRHHLSDVVFVLTLPPNHPGTGARGDGRRRTHRERAHGRELAALRRSEPVTVESLSGGVRAS